mgnify:CR=1 FL=1
MTNKTLTKTAKRKILFDQTCQYITTLGFDGPHDDDGYGRINFFKEDENIFLTLSRSSMTLCSTSYNIGSYNPTSAENYETNIESFIENQKVALDLNI